MVKDIETRVSIFDGPISDSDEQLLSLILKRGSQQESRGFGENTRQNFQI